MELPPLIQKLQGQAASLVNSYREAKTGLKDLRSAVVEAKAAFEEFDAFARKKGFSQLAKEIGEARSQLTLLSQGFRSTQEAVVSHLNEKFKQQRDRALAGDTRTAAAVGAGGTGILGIRKEQQQVREEAAIIEQLNQQKDRQIADNARAVAKRVQLLKAVSAKNVATAESVLGIKARGVTTPEEDDQMLLQRHLGIRDRAAAGGGGKDGKGFIGKIGQRFNDFFNSQVGEFTGWFLQYHQLVRGIREMTDGWMTIIRGTNQAKITIIQGLGQAASDFINGASEGFRQVAHGLFSGLEEAVRGLLHGDLVGGSLRGLGTSISQSIMGMARTATSAISGATHSLASIIGGMGQLGGAESRGAGELAGGAVSIAGAAAGFAVGGPAGLGITIGTSVLGSVTTALGRIAGEIEEMTTRLAATVVTSVGGIIANVVHQVAESVSSAVAGALSIAAEFASAMATRGIEVERVQAIFSTLLSNAVTGQRVFAELQQMSIFTPYTIHTLSEVSQELLAVGISAEQLIPVMSRLGQIALGNDASLRQLAKLFGDVAEGGKLTQFRMREFAKVGLTAKDFAQTMGVPVKEFQRQLTGGNVGPDVVAETINRVTSAGGRFAEANQRIMGQAYGQWHRLNSIIDTTLQKMGKGFTDSSGLARGLNAVSDFIERNMDVLVRFAERAGAFIGELAKQAAALGQAFSTVFNWQVLGGQGAAGMQMPDASQVVTGALEVIKTVSVALGQLASVITDITTAIMQAAGPVMSLIATTLDNYVKPVITKDLSGGVFTAPSKLELLLGPGSAPLAGILSQASDNLRVIGQNITNMAQTPAWGIARNKAHQLPFTIGSFFDDLISTFQRRIQQLKINAIPTAFGVSGKWEGGHLFGGVGRDATGGMGRFVPINPKIEAEKGLGERAQEMQKSIAKKEVEGRTALEKFRKALAAADEIDKAAKEGIGGGVGGMGEVGLGVRAQIENQRKALAAITQGTSREKFDAFQELRRAVGGSISDHLPAAAEYGSAEAMDAINKSNSLNRDLLQEVVTTLQASKDIAEQDSSNQKEFRDRIVPILDGLVGAGIK